MDYLDYPTNDYSTNYPTPFKLSSVRQNKSLSPSNITRNSAQRTGSNPLASTTVSIRPCPVEKSPKHDRPHERSGKFAAIVFPIWPRICSRRTENLEKLSHSYLRVPGGNSEAICGQRENGHFPKVARASTLRTWKTSEPFSYSNLSLLPF